MPTDVLVDLFAQPVNAYIMAATWTIVAAILKLVPERSILVRFRPLFPIVIASLLVYLPGVQPDTMGASSKLLIGVILGGACGHLHKVWGQTVMGKDARIGK